MPWWAKQTLAPCVMSILTASRASGRCSSVPLSDPTRDAASPFNSYQPDGRLSPFELTTPPKAGLGPADPGIVNFHLAMQPLTRGVHHRASQLVQQHPRGFVPTKSRLLLEQERRNPPLISDHQIGCPEPHRQWRSCVVENRAGCQRNLVSALNALPPSMFPNPIRPPAPAAGTFEAVRPTTPRQVVLTRILGSKLPLELAHILGKPRSCHTPTLHMVPC